MTGVWIVGGLSAAALWLGGYLFGAQRGRALRDELARAARAGGADAEDADRVAAVRRAVVEALDPLLSQEQLAARLREIPAGRHPGDLGRLLDEIATRAGVSALVLCDAEGLAVASSSATFDADRLAAVASAYLALADRYDQLGVPVPQAFVARDADHQSVLYRIFTVCSNPYVLSAVTKGTPLSPHALDAALDKIEHALRRQRWSA